MVTYARRALPWRLLATGAGLVILIMAVLRTGPLWLWPLQTIAVGMLAATVSWCFDERAAEVVDACPRGLGWRTMVRSSGALAALVAWAVATYSARDELFGHAWAVLFQGVAMALLTLAWVTWQRRRGAATPGSQFTVVAVPTFIAWGLIRPFPSWLPLFPYPVEANPNWWAISTLVWAGLALGAAGALTAMWASGRWARFS